MNNTTQTQGAIRTVDCSRVRTGRRLRSGIPYTVDPRTQPRTRIRVRTRLQSTVGLQHEMKINR